MTTLHNTPEPHGSIYCISSTRTNKLYIGQTVRTIDLRLRQHLQCTGRCRALESAIKKYGSESFSIRELCVAHSQAELDLLEQKWIARLNTVSPNGYNLSGGGGGAGKMHDETKAIMSAIGKTPAHIANLREINSRPEVIAKVTAGKIERWRNPEWKAKTSAACMAGRTADVEKLRRDAVIKTWASSEVRQAQSARQREIQNRPEVKAQRSVDIAASWASLTADERAARGAAISAGTTGVKKTVNRSAEATAARSEARKKAWQSPERKAKFAATMAALYADPVFLKRRGAAIAAGKQKAKLGRFISSTCIEEKENGNA